MTEQVPGPLQLVASSDGPPTIVPTDWEEEARTQGLRAAAHLSGWVAEVFEDQRTLAKAGRQDKAAVEFCMGLAVRYLLALRGEEDT